MTSLLRDLRQTFQSIRRNPLLASIIILTLALGIGACGATFSLISAVLLRSLPVENPDELVILWRTRPAQGMPRAPISVPDFKDLHEQSQVFSAAAVFAPVQLALTRTNQPEQEFGMYVSPSFMTVIRATPLLGRTFSERSTPGQGSEVIVSHALWQRQLGADPGAIGRSIILDGQGYTVIGVMPPGFQFPPFFNLDGGIVPKPIDLWVPINLETGRIDGFPVDDRNMGSFCVIARLKPGVARRQAQAQADAVASRLATAYPVDTGAGFVVLGVLDQMVGDFRRALLVLLGGVLFVLAIGVANAANLLLSRGVSRERELAIRLAVGATRGRLLAQLLTESIALSVLASILGLALAWGASQLLRIVTPSTVPLAGEIGLDWRVLVLLVTVVLLTGLALGVIPALEWLRPNVERGLREGFQGISAERHRGRVRDALAVVEVALAVVLLCGAGLMAKTFLRIRAVNPGYSAGNLLTLRVRLDAIRYPDRRSQTRFFRQLLERVRVMPGVSAVGATDALPFSQAYDGWNFTVEGHPVPVAGRPLAFYHVVSPGFFAAMGIKVTDGRDFNEDDAREDPKVVIVNETMVRQHFHGEPPIGKRVALDPDSAVWRQVVGVAADVKHQALEIDPLPDVYSVYLQPSGDGPKPEMTLVVRTEMAAGSMAAAIRREVAAIDREQPVHDVRMMADYLRDSVARRRFTMLVLGAFGAVALVIAGVGLYGVIAYSVSRRTKEIGLRSALGASSGDVLRLVVGRTALLTGLGLTIGLGMSVALGRVVSTLLFDVRATDAFTMGTVSVTLAVAALLASYAPTRRALGISPMTALRDE